jgi:hypothetical protein
MPIEDRDMQICKTCKYWNQVAGLGECDKDTSRTPLTSFEAVAEIEDDCGLRVFFRTGPHFGCVHHEPAAPE